MSAPLRSHAPAQAGLGTLCAESQADGVPCAEHGSDCAICGRALPCPESHEPETTVGSGAETVPRSATAR
jgi:hypothetical protein